MVTQQVYLSFNEAMWRVNNISILVKRTIELGNLHTTRQTLSVMIFKKWLTIAMEDRGLALFLIYLILFFNEAIDDAD